MIEKFNKSELHKHLEYQEAQLRVQLQTEEVTMTSRGKFPRYLRKREASRYERTTVGDSKQKVAGIYNLCFLENRGEKTYQGGGGSKHEEHSRRELLTLLTCSSSTIGNGLFVTPLRRQKKVILHYRRCDLQKGTLGNFFHQLLLLNRTHDRLPMKVPQKRKDAAKFEFEPWPQASKFISWRVSFRRDVMSGSTHPRLISECLAEIDMAVGVEDLDYSGLKRE